MRFESRQKKKKNTEKKKKKKGSQKKKKNHIRIKTSGPKITEEQAIVHLRT
jgi:hypothetical protein